MSHAAFGDIVGSQDLKGRFSLRRAGASGYTGESRNAIKYWYTVVCDVSREMTVTEPGRGPDTSMDMALALTQFGSGSGHGVPCPHEA